MKKIITNESKCYICTRRHKVVAWAVLVGIFFCGMMTGISLWGYKHAQSAESAVYSEKLSPCKMRENALLANIATDIDDTGASASADIHRRNADVYDKLVRWGCGENQKEYEELRDAEFSVYEVLRGSESEQPCRVIETELLRLISNGCQDNPECYLNNAEIYSKMVEDGCPENRQKYGQKALDELQISEGVRVNENNIDRYEMRSTVNTYKKLQMQNEAKKYIKKVEKLVDPGIDFIMELQRVIEE